MTPQDPDRPRPAGETRTDPAAGERPSRWRSRGAPGGEDLAGLPTGLLPPVSLRGKLDRVIAKLPPDAVTLGRLLQLIGREGLRLCCVMLCIPLLVPVTIPGVGLVFGSVIGLIGVGIALRRSPWLPGRLLRRPLRADAVRRAMDRGLVWVGRIERISRPRLRPLTGGKAMEFVNGLFIVACGALLLTPFMFVPLSNTLPGLGVILLAMGMLQRDGACVLFGYAFTLAAAGYFYLLGVGGLTVLDSFWELVRTPAL